MKFSYILRCGINLNKRTPDFVPITANLHTRMKTKRTYSFLPLLLCLSSLPMLRTSFLPHFLPLLLCPSLLLMLRTSLRPRFQPLPHMPSKKSCSTHSFHHMLLLTHRNCPIQIHISAGFLYPRLRIPKFRRSITELKDQVYHRLQLQVLLSLGPRFHCF